jgi:hypothetical protein
VRPSLEPMSVPSPPIRYRSGSRCISGLFRRRASSIPLHADQGPPLAAHRPCCPLNSSYTTRLMDQTDCKPFRNGLLKRSAANGGSRPPSSPSLTPHPTRRAGGRDPVCSTCQNICRQPEENAVDHLLNQWPILCSTFGKRRQNTLPLHNSPISHK